MVRDEKLFEMSKRKAYLLSCIENGQTQTRYGRDLPTELEQKVADIAEYKQVDE